MHKLSNFFFFHRIINSWKDLFRKEMKVFTFKLWNGGKSKSFPEGKKESDEKDFKKLRKRVQ